MGRKFVDRKLLEDVLNVTRAYWNTEMDEREIAEECKHCQEVAEVLMDDCGIGVWEIRDFAGGIFRYNGLKPDATNEEVIALLKQLGWTVVNCE